MTTQSEERLPDSARPAEPGSTSARILPFERPQSDLQRAIQQRAQEAIDVDRDRDREKKKPRPLRRIIILALALIPVIIIFGMVDGFLRALHKFNETWQSQPAAPASEPAPEEEVQQTQPGVVLLQAPETMQPEQQGESATPAPASGGSSEQSSGNSAPRQ